MKGRVYAVPHRQGTQAGRLPASSVLRPGGVLRQPDLPSPDTGGGTHPTAPGPEPKHRATQEDHYDFRAQSDLKEYKGKLQSVIEDLDLPNPVIRSHYGHGFAQQYVRDDRLLRTRACHQQRPRLRRE